MQVKLILLRSVINVEMEIVTREIITFFGVKCDTMLRL